MVKLILIILALSTAIFAFPSRIVNGTNAKEGEFPFIVSLRKNGRHSCGGSILDETHILTAAHCVAKSSTDVMSIQYGTTDLEDELHVVKVKRATWHPEYDRENNHINDVAVLELSSLIEFGPNVQATKLPVQNEPIPEEQPSILAGWGRNEDGRTDPKYHVCSGVDGGGKGQCNGDSGGPLYSNGIQVGIVSWSIKPCARPGYPGVFARVSSYTDWIRQQTF